MTDEATTLFASGDSVTWNPDYPKHDERLADYGPGPFRVAWVGPADASRQFHPQVVALENGSGDVLTTGQSRATSPLVFTAAQLVKV